ncbi:MAG: class I tRNA ligase family protein, partial [Phycisphaerae bacterium]|nr:class I tRNA ligase family protein [Phycisphaerae bacterium]
MTKELATVYDPRQVEGKVYDAWAQAGAFKADPDDERARFCMVIPPPNVTAALHLGHALNNTLQDVIIRYRRMRNFATLWMPGTDHAGIATQTVVEKRLLAEEGKRRTDYQREEFIGKVQAWKDEYEGRILTQLKTMGCSCDWDRTRFTMDDVCARAVRETFFRLFKDGLIYRGKRLVNWDPATQTVLADDEVEHEDVHGHFYYLRYPLVEERSRKEGEERVAGILPARGEGVPPSQDEPEIDKRKGRFLPHWTQEGATYAVTFRLADAVPKDVSDAWKQERQDILLRAEKQNRPLTHAERMELHQLHSAKIEAFLNAGHGECLLRNSRAAEITQNALKHFDGERYDLLAWAIMPNHVHAILCPRGEEELSGIIHSWKSFTAKEINRLLDRQGPLWMEEYYDHLIRDQEDLNHQVNYVLSNPDKANLHDWPWFGLKEERGQDALGTRGQDARDTTLGTRGQDARDTTLGTR